MIWAIPHIGWGHCCPVWRCLSMAFMFPRQYNWEPLDVTNCCIYCKIMLQIVQEPKAQSPISSGACPGMVRDAQKHHSGTLWRKLHQPLISIFNFHIWCDLEFRSQIVDCFSSHLLGIKIEKRRTWELVPIFPIHQNHTTLSLSTPLSLLAGAGNANWLQISNIIQAHLVLP